MRKLLWLTLPLVLFAAGCGDDYAIVYRSPDGVRHVVEDASWTERTACAFSRRLEAGGYAVKGSSLVTTHDAACMMIQQKTQR